MYFTAPYHLTPQITMQRPLLTEALAAAERDVGLRTAQAFIAPQDPAFRHPLAYAAHTPIRPPTWCGPVPWRAHGAYGSSSETAYPRHMVRPPPRPKRKGHAAPPRGARPACVAPHGRRPPPVRGGRCMR